MKHRRAPFLGAGVVCGATIVALLADPSTRNQLHQTAYALGIRRPAAYVQRAAPGQPMPALRLSELNGLPVDLSLANGTVVYNVFASWCGPCNAEAPSMRDAARALASRGVRFVGIDRGESAARVQAYAQRYGLAYPILLDASNETSGMLGSDVIPQTLIVRNGIVDRIVVGPVDASDLVRTVEGA